MTDDRFSGDPLKSPIDWDARLGAQVAAHAAKTAARRNEREEFKRRRNYGLRARYAAKAARNNEEPAMTDPGTPTEGLDQIIGDLRELRDDLTARNGYRTSDRRADVPTLAEIRNNMAGLRDDLTQLRDELKEGR